MRILGSNTTEKSVTALSPFFKQGFPSGHRRRAAQNDALNEITSTILRVGPVIAGINTTPTDEDARAAAARDAEAANVDPEEEEVEDTNAMWEQPGEAGEEDELATALGGNKVLSRPAPRACLKRPAC